MDHHLTRSRERTAGFTLIEMLVVIAVIGILIGITIGVTRSVEEKTNTAEARTELGVLAQALEQYKSNYGDYPWVTATTDQGRRESLYKALNGTQGPKGDKLTPQARVFIEHERFNLNDPEDPDDLENYLLDPWGQPYEYHYKDATLADPGAIWVHSSYVLFSKGPNGESKSNDPGADGRPDFEDPANLDNIYANRQ